MIVVVHDVPLPPWKRVYRYRYHIVPQCSQVHFDIWMCPFAGNSPWVLPYWSRHIQCLGSDRIDPHWPSTMRRPIDKRTIVRWNNRRRSDFHGTAYFSMNTNHSVPWRYRNFHRYWPWNSNWYKYGVTLHHHSDRHNTHYVCIRSAPCPPGNRIAMYSRTHFGRNHHTAMAEPVRKCGIHDETSEFWIINQTLFVVGPPTTETIKMDVIVRWKQRKTPEKMCYSSKKNNHNHHHGIWRRTTKIIEMSQMMTRETNIRLVSKTNFWSRFRCPIRDNHGSQNAITSRHTQSHFLLLATSCQSSTYDVFRWLFS